MPKGEFVYVWKLIEHCTDNYHTEGGVVVFANTLDRAKYLAAIEGCKIKDDEAPDEIRSLAVAGDEAVYVMPDAGCC